jgi:ubiquinone/menaquinone biosynthesis C-methylase UbiE
VWIQAVLEHVLDPPIVVAEIYRVLRPGGLVYAALMGSMKTCQLIW